MKTYVFTCNYGMFQYKARSKPAAIKLFKQEIAKLSKLHPELKIDLNKLKEWK